MPKNFITEATVKIYSRDEEQLYSGVGQPKNCTADNSASITFPSLTFNGRTNYRDYWFEWEQRPIQVHFKIPVVLEDVSERVLTNRAQALSKLIEPQFASAGNWIDMFDKHYFGRKSVRPYVHFEWNEQHIELVDTARTTSKLDVIAQKPYSINASLSAENIFSQDVLFLIRKFLPAIGGELKITDRRVSLRSKWLNDVLPLLYGAYRHSIPLKGTLENVLAAKK